MGTRADFYVGKGKDAQWIGSIAWDGYRDGIPSEILGATTPESFREKVAAFLDERKDGTKPEMGWPWPWDDSATSDCSYWFFDGQVWESYYDRYLSVMQDYPDDDAHDDFVENAPAIDYPNMKDVKNVNFGDRSGVMFFSG